MTYGHSATSPVAILQDQPRDTGLDLVARRNIWLFSRGAKSTQRLRAPCVAGLTDFGGSGARWHADQFGGQLREQNAQIA